AAGLVDCHRLKSSTGSEEQRFWRAATWRRRLGQTDGWDEFYMPVGTQRAMKTSDRSPTGMLGVFIRLAAVALIVVMLGAIFLVHLPHGFDVSKAEWSTRSRSYCVRIAADGSGGVFALVGTSCMAEAT